MSGQCKGLLIVAGAGFGKTTVVEELVEFSCFGECRNNLVMECLSGCYAHNLEEKYTVNVYTW